MANKTVKKVVIRMYRLGTGDCFILRFKDHEDKDVLKMMIDAGAINIKKAEAEKAIQSIRSYVDNHLDILVVTHEHQDHVVVFNYASDLFGNDFKIDKLWLSWVEEDRNDEVKRWKKEYGQKKMALKMAADQFSAAMETEEYKAVVKDIRNKADVLSMNDMIKEGLSMFSDLHIDVPTDQVFNANKVYVGALKGMKVVKDKFEERDRKYCFPGDVLEPLGRESNLRVYVLGPPRNITQVKKHKGRGNESYQHNKDLDMLNSYATALEGPDNGNEKPFSERYYIEDPIKYLEDLSDAEKENNVISDYQNQSPWRKIEYDWLNTGALLALRMNSYTNNLSLVLAFEIEDEHGNQKVMLFPGDAEYGSWASWHDIDWKNRRDSTSGQDLTTAHLLNRTVFYKVAHHLSHNGTARARGLELMNDPELVAMATLDYSNIRSGWKKTMPNKAIVDELLDRTHGRLILLNEQEIFHRDESIEKAIQRRLDALSSAFKNPYMDAIKESTEEYAEYVLAL